MVITGDCVSVVHQGAIMFLLIHCPRPASSPYLRSSQQHGWLLRRVLPALLPKSASRGPDHPAKILDNLTLSS